MRSIGGTVVARCCRKIVRPKRTFFSNPCSTDNTMLLKQAVIHRIGDDPYGPREYVLAPGDIPLELVQRDPKLKLASIRADKNMIYGAKVNTVNIGGMVDVCGGLVDAALEDASSHREQPQGLTTLTGLCDWVLRGTEGEEDIPLLHTMQNMDPPTYAAVVAIATGVPTTFRDGQHGWEELAKEFVNHGLGEEPTLYLSKGGKLVTIEQSADNSENYLRSAGGAMAQFLFL